MGRQKTLGSQPVSTPPRAKALVFLHPGRWVAAWTLAAFLLRLANSFAQRDNPFLAYLPVDQGAYDRWAQQIAGGAWLGRSVFYQDPLYPYFLGLLYATIGRHLLVVLVLQGLLGALNVPLLWGIATRLWGERAGRIAALMAALYAPFIFYDGLVLKTFLEVLLLNAAVLATLWAADAAGPNREKSSAAAGRSTATVVRRSLVAGLLLGLGSLARASYPLLVPLLAAWVLWAGGRPGRVVSRGKDAGSRGGDHAPLPGGRRRLGLPRPTRAGSIGAAAVIAGTLLILLPVLIRNRAVGHDWVLTTSQAGQNFYIGNCATNQSGTYEAPAFVRPDPQHEEEDFRNEAQRRLGRSLKPSQVSTYWTQEAWSFIRAHPGRFLGLSVTRLGLLLHRYEIPDNEDIRIWAGYSPWLRFNPVRWDLVGPLAIAGLALCWRERRRGWLLYGLVGVYLFSMAAFFVLGRYRLPAASLLLVFAAGAIDAGWTAWKARDRRRLVIGGVALLLGIVIVHRPNRAERPAMSPSVYSLLGAAELAAGQVDEALVAQRKAVELAPNSAELRYNLASTLQRAGKIDEAIVEFRRVAAMTPNYAETWSALGNLLVEKGDIEGAVAAQRRALAIQPRLGIHLYNLARILYHAGHTAEASAVLDTLDAVKDPTYTQEGSIIRAMLLEEAGRGADAMAIVRGYLRANPNARTRPQLEELLRAWEKGPVAEPR
jgi:tetratricopeptide (TPR) repeat protein